MGSIRCAMDALGAQQRQLISKILHQSLKVLIMQECKCNFCGSCQPKHSRKQTKRVFLEFFNLASNSLCKYIYAIVTHIESTQCNQHNDNEELQQTQMNY